ncbi:MAG: ChaN family lipoprotein [Deltaproteobacteria bacterium]
MRPLSLAAAFSWLASFAALACGLVDSTAEERTDTRSADLAVRHLQNASPHHRHLRGQRRWSADPHQPASEPVDAPAPSPEPADAGAEEPSGELADAAPPDTTPADAAAPPNTAPPSLPRDIVAQSALPLHGLAAGNALSEAELWDRLAQTPAVCLGETHNIPADHYAETRAIAELAQRAQTAGAPLAVGFEMFQRQFQTTLAEFIAGQLDEATLLAGTEYSTRWGYDFSLYRPMLEAARDRGLPALALNMRGEITRKIARTSLDSLDASERTELPELNLADAEHREFIFGLFGVLPEHAAESGLEDVYVAQTVWDETMADSAARWLGDTGAGARIVILAGDAHCHESAIPRRLTRRTGLAATSVSIVLQSELAEPDFSADGYDLLIVLDDSGSP